MLAVTHGFETKRFIYNRTENLFMATPTTFLELGEVVNALNKFIRLLNKHRKRHDAARDPLQRAIILGAILKEMLKFQIYGKKLGASYMDLVRKNIADTSIFILKNPAYASHIESLRKQIMTNLELFIREQYNDRTRSRYLISSGGELLSRAKAAAAQTSREIRERIARLKAEQQRRIMPQQQGKIINNRNMQRAA